MDALEYAKQLISFESTSRLSNVEVSDFCERTLRQLDFLTERIEYDDDRGVRKVCIVGKKGSGTGGLAYFGHTDVVPADDWYSKEHGPFEPLVHDGKLFGRGSCDMKGSVACILAAAGRFPSSWLKQPLYVTCTADEEIGYGGAQQVADRSLFFREMASGGTRGIIGEPTRLQVVHAHKGTYGFQATSFGRAAHSSTRDGLNANLAMIPFLAEMKTIHDATERDPAWHNAEFDPPVVSWNIGVNDFTRAVNVTAAKSICTVYFRPMPGQNGDLLLRRAREAAERCGLQFAATSANPALHADPQSPFIQELLKLTENETSRTVAYGTDGCIFAKQMNNLVVFGPGSIAQAHTCDEWISLEQLERGTEMFSRLIRRWCADPALANRGTAPVTTRVATPDDVPAIAELVEPYVAQRKLLPRNHEELARLARHGFVAEAEGKVVGFAAVEIYSKKLAEVQCLAVSDDYQRRGIGKRLVQMCIDCSREHQILELMAISASDDFLKECGFHYALPDQKRALFIRTRDS